MTQLPQNQRFGIAEKEAQMLADKLGSTHYVIMNSRTTKIVACDRKGAMKLLNSSANGICSIHEPGQIEVHPA